MRFLFSPIKKKNSFIYISSVQLLSHVPLFSTPWIAARQASLSITNSRSLLKLMSIESVMPSSHLILCRPLLLLPPIPSSIRVFSNESPLRMRWPKDWRTASVGTHKYFFTTLGYNSVLCNLFSCSNCFSFGDWQLLQLAPVVLASL